MFNLKTNVDMGTRKGYPFSRRAYNQGLGILSNTILGCLGLGVLAAKGIKDFVEDNTYNNVPVGKYYNYTILFFIALLFAIPLWLLSIHIPLIGEIVFIVLFTVLSTSVSECYFTIKRFGVIKKLLILLSVWIYSFIVAYMIEDYIETMFILSFVPVLSCIIGYIKGCWENRKTNI